jgi:uncharacterized protein YbbK (DUF523 family)
MGESKQSFETPRQIVPAMTDRLSPPRRVVAVNPNMAVGSPVPRDPYIIDTAIPIASPARIISSIADVDVKPEGAGRWHGCRQAK